MVATTLFYLPDQQDFDLFSFAQEGRDTVCTWLRSFLQKSDNYFYATRRNDAPPSPVIIDLLRRMGTGHESFKTIAEAINILLDQLLSVADGEGANSTQERDYVDEILSICMKVRLPQTKEWFVVQVRSLAESQESFEAIWKDPLDRIYLVSAAALQAPAVEKHRRVDRLFTTWKAVMGYEQYASVAFRAFGSSYLDRVEYLNEWWRHAPPSSKDRELYQVIDLALKARHDAPAHLVDSIDKWDDDLREKVFNYLECQHNISFWNMEQHNIKDAVGRKVYSAIANIRYNLLRIEGRHEVANPARLHIISADSFAPAIAHEIGWHFKREISRLKLPATKLVSRDTKNFAEVTDEYTAEVRHVFYTFPFYLTARKRRSGFNVFMYGRHARFGCVAISPNWWWSMPQIKDRNTIDIVELLREVWGHESGRIVYIRNYAIAEILTQCIHTSADCLDLDVGPIIKVESEESTSFNLKDRDVILFDLGDSTWGSHPQLVRAFQEKEKKSTSSPLEQSKITSTEVLQGLQRIVSHSADVPVGLGFNANLAPWLLQRHAGEARWLRLSSAAKQVAINPSWANHLASIGVEPIEVADVTPPEGENVFQARRSKQGKSR